MKSRGTAATRLRSDNAGFVWHLTFNGKYNRRDNRRRRLNNGCDSNNFLSGKSGTFARIFEDRIWKMTFISKNKNINKSYFFISRVTINCRSIFHLQILIFFYLSNYNVFRYNEVIFFQLIRALSMRTEITRERSTPLDGGCAKYFYQRITEAVIFAADLPFTRINERIYSYSSTNYAYDTVRKWKLKCLMLFQLLELL